MNPIKPKIARHHVSPRIGGYEKCVIARPDPVSHDPVSHALRFSRLNARLDAIS